MITEKEVSMMAEIMDSILQTDEWMEMQLTDPMINAADNRWRLALEEAKAYLPHSLYVELSDANANDVAIYCDLAILYGMHVAGTIQRVAANPQDLSTYWLKRMEAINQQETEPAHGA